MKTKIVLLILLSGALFFRSEGGNLTDDGSSSLKSKDIRQVELKEVFRIIGEDENGQYFLKYPLNLKVDPSGNIFVLDKDQFLAFDPSGKFLKNLMKKGQGPGELLNISNYLLHNNSILIHNQTPNKILRLDISGNLIEEFRVYENLWLDFFYADKNKLYFLTTIVEDTKGKGKVIDIGKKLLSLPRAKISKAECEAEELFIFPVKSFVYKTNTASFMIKLNSLKSCRLKDFLFFVSHTQKYEIKLIDIEKKKILTTIKRPYKRVKVTKDTEKFTPFGQFVYDGKMYSSPRLEYFNDIQSIHFSDNKLWVFTSTVDEKKGVLVDRFDNKGEYIDSLFVKFPNQDTHYRVEQVLTVLTKGYLYIIERDKDDNRFIVKYRFNHL
jgi:hypothetical protein